MKKLFTIDLKDYEEGWTVFRRPSARAIIFADGKISLVYSNKENYYKFPGGGIRVGEDKKTALIREVREEAGLVVVPESVVEFGSVMRRQKSDLNAETIFEQENFYYFCDVHENVLSQNLDDYEKEAGFVLRTVSLDEAIKINSEYKSDNFFNTVMIEREKQVMEIIREKIFEQ